MNAQIRLATEQDAAQIQAIYAPFVRDTVISFELDVPTVDEIRKRIAKTLTFHPWLVCERDGEVLGYAYAGPHRARLAYQWAVDVSVYLNPTAQGQGLGTALYTALFAVLRLQGFFVAYAGATLPNAASVGLHESLGFETVGIYQQVGYKFGKWHDVIWWQLVLQSRNDLPLSPVGIETFQDSIAFRHALLVR